jgi:signal transduction histidine kinase
MALPLLRVENLSKSFDRLPVLKDVSFSVERGEILGLVGRQGAGRSTLFHLLSGAMRPTSGTILFDGAIRRYASLAQAQKLSIETVYRSSGAVDYFDASSNLVTDSEFGIETSRRTSSLVEQLDVAHNMFLGREPKKYPLLGVIDWDRMILTAQSLLAEFDLSPELVHEKISNLTDEQRQILILARSFYQPCRLLLLDDILPVLSFKRQEILMQKIKNFAAQGTAVIISSDDLKQLFAMTDRILVLYEGKLVADRRTVEVTPREIVELIVGSSREEQISPLIWALESYHAAQKQAEELTRRQMSLQESLEARTSLNRQLFERLRNQVTALDQLNAALQATQRRLITEREDERKALARELHDQIIQDMLSVNYRLEEIENVENSPVLQQEIESIRQLIRSMVGELRQLCGDLRPPSIEHHGLSAAIDSLAHEWAERNDIQLQLEIDPSLGRLPETIELSVFRIVQEGLNNIRKHALARHVRLSLQRTSAANLLVRLEDDGRGLAVPVDLASLSVQKHYGLVGISERVALLGGLMHVESSNGNGTILQVEIPSPYPITAN